MGYLGNTPTTQSFISGTDYFNGDGSTTAFTLTRTVASVNDIEAVVNNVVQQPNSAYNISGTTITFTSAPSAGTGNVYVRYLSTTTQSITPSQNTVSYSTLNTDMQNLFGQSFTNRLINGAMMIDQRNAGAAITAGGFPVDRFACAFSTDGAFSAQQDSSAPAGFTNSVKCTTTTADASLSASQYWLFRQRIEGYNVADLDFGTANAKTVTLSFWVRSSLTGTFGGSIMNSAANRAYPFTYTISVADTWEQKSVTIAGDTSGTWLKTNGNGMVVVWSLGIGSNYQATANTWGAGEYYGTSSSTSVIGTLNATWYVTGVQLEKGSTATSFDYRPYGTELALCQRYYTKFIADDPYTTFLIGTLDSSTVVFNATTTLPVQMRSQPTISQSSCAIFDGSGRTAISSTGTNRSSKTSISQSFTASGASFTIGRCGQVQGNNSTSAYIDASAEL